MFEKTLSDVVKGIRASKRDTGIYISQCIAEIKTELNSTDLYVKANALQKLTFLQMMGYGMSWASFATIEVMSSPRFAHKRIGYLAASQGFNQDTEVILLTTNLLKKELRGATSGNMQGVYEAGLAINCISNIVTEDLARDLLPELTNLTSHPQPYLRKKALLCLFKLFVKYPQGLRLTFDRIEQCLTDSNPSVVSCAVNVITELSDKNPKNYLPLAPAFFSLLTGSTNNWMLIKVVKLLGSLVPEEPRLARKLLEPLATMVRNTQAKSLLFESVHTLTLSLPYCRKSDGTMPPIVPDIIELCAKTLREFVEEEDQNLKYLGLVGFGSLTVSHPKVLSSSEYRPLLLACLSDDDVTIRTRALDLLPYMTSRKNLVELVTQLWTHVTQASGQYKNDLVLKIVEMCSGDKYALLTDFGWYFNLLLGLGHMRGIETHGSLLKQQVWDVALRVLPVRTYAVRRSMEQLLERSKKPTYTGGTTVDVEDNGRGKHIMPELLPALAWIVGEYSSLIREALDDEEEEEESFEFLYDKSSKGAYHALVQALLAPSNIRDLPTSTQSIYVQASMKIFAAATADSKVPGAELEGCLDMLKTYLPVYAESTDVEVQERAFTSMELLRSLDLLGFDLSGAPGLVLEDDDDESGSSEEGNLLGMAGPSSKTKEKPDIPTMRPSKSSSLKDRCRNAAPLLNYLLKPEPMKPVSAKAQRKKRQTPLGVDVDLDAPIDMSVFASFLEEERSRRPPGTTISMESVSFTQQRPLRPTAPPAEQSAPSMDTSGFGGVSDGTGVGSTTSFQKSGMSEQTVETSALAQPQQQRHQHDPFYLDSGGPSEAEGVAVSNRFGAIQLGDSDEESDEPRKRKKKKKAKRRKQEREAKSAVGDLGAADLSLLSTTDATSVPKPHRTHPPAPSAITVYSSDDDEEEHAASAQSKKKGPGKEFASLAKVDLTTPLREDEVMPTREHRVVPERHAEERPRKESRKKKKKESKKSKKLSETAPAGGVGDLLDLGGFMPVADVSSEAAAPTSKMASAGGSSAISTAFDDLLGLSAPSPSVAQEDIAATKAEASPKRTSSKKHGKQPWIKGTIKGASVEGSSVVDWTKVRLLFKAQKMGGDQVSAALNFRIENHTGTLLPNVKLTLKDRGDTIDLGTVEPGTKSDSEGKSGPIPYEHADTSMDIKAFLTTLDCKVPLKLTLPAALFLNPWNGLTNDDVMKELSSSTQWHSYSAKLDSAAVKDPAKARPMLLSYLHAAEVEGDSATDPLVGTLAAQSSRGFRVLALVKAKKDSSVKVDIKCTDDRLGKALASDIKKLAK